MMMGHSLGAAAALGVGRYREGIKVAVALEAPFMADVLGLDENDQFVFVEEDYPIPVLQIYSDSSWSHLEEWGQYAENVKLLGKESDTVKNVHMNDVGHLGLNDLSMETPILTTLLDGGMKKEPQENLKEIVTVQK